MGWKDLKTRTAEQVTYMWPFLQLGFLTAWLPQRSQTSYMAAEGSTQKVPAHKAEAVLPFITASEVTQLHSHQSLFIPRKSQAHPT